MCTVTTPWSRESFGGRGADVVGVRVRGHRRPGQPHHVRERHRAQDDPGQQQPREGRPIAHRHGRDSEPDTEDELRQKPEDEYRDRDDDEAGDQHRGIKDSALAQAGDHAKPDAQQSFHGHRDQGQPRSNRKGMRQNGTDRKPGVGATQIAMQDATQVTPVLHDEGIVEVVTRPEGRGHRGSQRTVPCHRRHRITG